jgi:hypothetical protein
MFVVTNSRLGPRVASQQLSSDLDAVGHGFDLADRNFSQVPFRYATFAQCLSPSTGGRILQWFETAAPWNHVETEFYEQHEFSCWDAAGVEAAFLTSDQVVGGLRNELSALFGCPLRRDATVVAHRLIAGHRIGIHNDHLEDGESHRFVIQLNRGLTDEDGGLFMLFNSRDAGDIHAILRPTHLSGFAFEISPESYHAISQMHSNVRYSIVYSFLPAL